MKTQNVVLEKSNEENYIDEKTFSEKSVENFDLLSVFNEFVENLLTLKKNIYFESLSYESNPDFDCIEFFVCGVFPENIENFFSNYSENEKCIVNLERIFYENQEPKIQGKVIAKSKLVKNENSLKKIENPLVDFRNYLIKNSISLEDENHETMNLTFHLSKSKLKEIFDNYENSDLKMLNYVKVNSNYDDENIFLEVVFFSKSDIFDLSGFSLKDFFSENMQILLSHQRTQSQTQIAEKLESQKNEKQIVGKIKSKDGQVLYLVKDKNGKITKE